MKNKQKPSNIKYVLMMRILLIMTIVVIVNEMLFRFSVLEVIQWVFYHPLLFVMNIAFLVGHTALLILLFRRVYGAIWFVGITALILGVINANKASIRSVPLIPQDFALIRELWVLLPEFFSPLWVFLVVLSIPLGYGIFILMKKLVGNHGSIFIKRSMAILLVVSLVILAIGQVLYTKDLDPWKTGIIYSMSNFTRPEPEVEDPEIEEEAESFLDEVENDMDHRPSRVKPNVIILMSEAFWDVNRLNVDFSVNPVEHFQELQSEGVTGEIYVPVFGGGTANTEFEVLTGLTLKNYPADYHIVYRENIKDKTESLASIFSDEGYRSIAIHPYYPWYYQRDEVFRYFGFEEFISIENMVEAQEYGPFISDEYVTDLLIEQLEKTEKPLFLFSVTMQNHGPYNEEREEPWLNIEGDLDENLMSILRTYSQGLYYSDQELKRLVEYLDQHDEPTLLLFFGDHLPMLGNNYGVYRQLNYIGEETQEELQGDLRLRTVPYVLWANYPMEHREIPLMNASYLAPLILEKAKQPLPTHMQGIRNLYERMPFFKRDYGMTAEGTLYEHTSDEYQEVLTIYRMINERVINQGWEIE